MNRLKWWLRIVGLFYLFIGIWDLNGTLSNPQFWIVTEDELAVKALSQLGLVASLSVLVLAGMMFMASGMPDRAIIFVWYVIALEFLLWVPFNTYSVLREFALHEAPVESAYVFILLHLTFGITGVILLRRAQHE